MTQKRRNQNRTMTMTHFSPTAVPPIAKRPLPRRPARYLSCQKTWQDTALRQEFWPCLAFRPFWLLAHEGSSCVPPLPLLPATLALIIIICRYLQLALLRQPVLIITPSDHCSSNLERSTILRRRCCAINKNMGQ